MNSKRQGWFRAYIEHRREHPLPERLPTYGVKILEDAGLHNESDQAIYFFLQPTGLLYGAPLAYPFPEEEYPHSRYDDRSAHALMIQLDAIMACLVADRHYLLAGLSEEADSLDSAIQIVEEYHLHYPPEWADGQRSLGLLRSIMRRSTGDHERFEDEFRRRVLVSGNLLLLRTPLANIFLFLDLYHCLLWQRKRLLEGALPPEGLFAQYREQLAQREALLKLILATLYTERRIDRAGWRLVERFLRASRLPADRQRELRRIARGGIALEDVAMPEMPWLIRRYFLGLTVMTAFLDRSVSEREQALLEGAVERLGLWREELDQSRAAFEAFVLDHGRAFSFGQAPNLIKVAEHLREQASLAIRRNLGRIVQEIQETHELYALLIKSTRQPLTGEEKRRVRAQLLDILKTIPALAIFALPGGGIILPILIHLLPFNLLPSSFEE
jgi:hypothetical protein